MIPIAFVTGMILAGTPASAGARAAVGDTSRAPAAKTTADKKICRRIDVTGSIIAFRRVCDTAAGWAKFDRETNEAWESARYSKNRSWSKSLPQN